MGESWPTWDRWGEVAWSMSPRDQLLGLYFWLVMIDLCRKWISKVRVGDWRLKVLASIRWWECHSCMLRFLNQFVFMTKKWSTTKPSKCLQSWKSVKQEGETSRRSNNQVLWGFSRLKMWVFSLRQGVYNFFLYETLYFTIVCSTICVFELF